MPSNMFEGADVIVCTGVKGWLGEHHVHRPWRCWRWSTGQIVSHTA